jgi:hypothetical protein
MLGSARGSRAGFGVTPKQSFINCERSKERRESKEKFAIREDALASTRNACAPRNALNARFVAAHPIKIEIGHRESLHQRNTMRTTVTLDDDAYEIAVTFAKTSGKRLGQAISDLIRRSAQKPQGHAPPEAANAFPHSRCRHGFL